MTANQTAPAGSVASPPTQTERSRKALAMLEESKRRRPAAHPEGADSNKALEPFDIWLPETEVHRQSSLSRSQRRRLIALHLFPAPTAISCRRHATSQRALNRWHAAKAAGEVVTF